MSERQNPLWQLTLARWRAFYREPSALFWTFGFPIVLSIALGIAFRNQPPQPVNCAIEVTQDAASRAEGEHLLALLGAGGQVKARLLDPDAAHRLLRTGRVDVVVVPASAANRLRVYRYDPTRPESRTARLLVDDLLQRAEGRIDRSPTADARVTEPGSRYIDFLVPGLLGMGLMSSGLWGIGFVLVEMRVRKLIKRLVATPMRKRDFLIAFVMMRGMFLLGELPLLIGFAHYMFAVPVRGSPFTLLVVALAGALTFASMGLLVASRATNTQTVGGLVNLVTLPMSILGGVFFAYQRFPEPMHRFLRLLPLTALNDAVRAILLEGAGWSTLGGPMLVLVTWGVLSMTLALRLFRWR